tara:strand:+ start:107 stop:373 length:267 start_codon:yes stop_codon:yes gene_type:complete
MYSYNTKVKQNKKKPIKITIDIKKLKNKILILKDEIYKKQKELIDFMNFYEINNKNDSDIKQINKEIYILNNKLDKSMILYKQYKDIY